MLAPEPDDIRSARAGVTAQKNINRKPVTIEVPMLPVLQSIIF
jgi:hypothetical protein